MGGSTFPHHLKPMPIITHFSDSIPEYVQKGKDNYFPPIFGCPCCSYHGKLHRHGFYQRNVVTANATYTIYIARKICPVCRKTFSQIPDFLIPYFQYSYEVIYQLFSLMFLKELSFLQTLNQMAQNQSLSLSKQHLSFYRQRFIQSKGLIRLFFTGQFLFYDNMDFSQLELHEILHSLMSKIHAFSQHQQQTFNLAYFKSMPTYFFAPTCQ